MYNRYTPQPDGSYRRNSAPEATPPVTAGPADISPVKTGGPAFSPPPPRPAAGPLGIGSFFRQLLPAGFDTEDLLVVLLLLLMSPDQGEDRSWAMLTLALYLFL